MKMKIRYLAGAGALLTLAACGGAATAGVTRPAPLPTVAQVASTLKATRTVTCPSGPNSGAMAGVVSSGVAWLGSEKIGIDTFATPVVRDNWEISAENFGVIPFAYGTTWVAYKAVSQSGPACS